ncbi:unnamed protein product [Durusdinium trenchii]|uniref:Uncharacterized protein n=1 Tax=Durusdinium trenchii TaxID=1381693 RepID=A0ABP0SKI0_9DINO
MPSEKVLKANAHDEDFEERYVTNYLRDIDAQFAMPSIEHLGPGSFSGPCRFLEWAQPVDIFYQYVAHEENEGRKPSTLTTFMKVYHKVFGTFLKFRGKLEHAQCNHCARLKAKIKGVLRLVAVVPGETAAKIRVGLSEEDEEELFVASDIDNASTQPESGVMEETDVEAFVDGPVSSPDAARPFNDLGILQDHDCDFRDSNTAINVRGFTKDYLHIYQRKLHRSFGGVNRLADGVIRIGSICSGLGTAEMLECTFMVEIEKKKRDFLLQFKPKQLFKDMAEIGRLQAETHDGTYQLVPKACGFHCYKERCKELGGKEMAMLQGLGDEDWFSFGMDKLPPALAQNFLGNAHLITI